MTVLRTDRKHASNCMTEENGVEKVKKRKNFFRSLRFRILIILIILGIVPGVIVTYTMLHNYQNRAVAMLTETVGDQCDILCNLIIRENYLNDTDSEVVNSKLELFSNVYNGRILLADRDFKIVSDTFHTEEGKTLLSSLAVACLKGEETSNYDARSKVLELAVPVQSPDVQQLQGVMLVSVSAVDIAETLAEMEQRGVMLIGSIVVLSVFLAWLLSTILVKPLARVTKAIEDLTDGMLDEEISVPDYTETELITDAFNKMVNRMKILDESRQEFVSNVSHELKTPLTSMKVLADSLVGQQGVPEELYQEFMSDITAEIDRENKIITDLLSLVKMDKKAADVNITHMDINQLLEDILKRLRPIADRRNIDLILDCFRPVDADVDEVKFTLAVSNLVENGIKYNVDDGWVRVSLDADHKYFYITVADSGMGIPEDSIERIFERFYQIRNSHNNSNVGTGIGLHLSRSLIELHHGTIEAENNEGKPGSRFIIRLPLGKEHLNAEEIDNNPTDNNSPIHITTALPTSPVDEEDEKIRSRTKNRVLVVEDDEEIRKYICRELASDFHMSECTNGKEALAMILKKEPDLIISDIMMPEMDGLTLCKKIKQNVTINHIPIILLTAKSREEDNLEGLNMGADAYIVKPFSIEILRKTAINLIKSREVLRNSFSGSQMQEQKLKKLKVQSPDDRLLNKVMKVINDNLGNPDLNVEMIATEVGISRVHLHRKLKELTNQSTRDLIRNVRLKQAASLLANQYHNITEVASLTGFTNIAYFSTAFKELYGVPPTSYMEEQQKSSFSDGDKIEQQN